MGITFQRTHKNTFLASETFEIFYNYRYFLPVFLFFFLSVKFFLVRNIYMGITFQRTHKTLLWQITFKFSLYGFMNIQFTGLECR